MPTPPWTGWDEPWVPHKPSELWLLPQSWSYNWTVVIPHLCLLIWLKTGSTRTWSGSELPFLAGRRDAQVGNVQWMGREQNCPPCCHSLSPSCGCPSQLQGSMSPALRSQKTVAWSVHLLSVSPHPASGDIPQRKGPWKVHPQGHHQRRRLQKSSTLLQETSGEEKVVGLHRGLTEDCQATALGLSSSSWLKPDPGAWSLWWNWIPINVGKGNILREGGRLAGSPAVLDWAVGWAFLLKGPQEPLLCGMMTALRNWRPEHTHCSVTFFPLLLSLSASFLQIGDLGSIPLPTFIHLG